MAREDHVDVGWTIARQAPLGFQTQQVLTSDPDEKTEQDYFDREMAATGSSDMQDEIERLSRLFAKS